MRIIIFSRPIHSGKTTELAEWCTKQSNVAGVLMPDVDGVRMMQDIRSGELWEAECKSADANEELITIGKYRFYHQAFDRANQVIHDALLQEPEWLVIDEVGKLELERKGFYSSVRYLIDSSRQYTQMIMVVRDSLVDDVIKYFNINELDIINTLEELPTSALG